MSRLAQRVFALTALPVLLLLLVPPELACCAAPNLLACGAGGDADCCGMAEQSKAAEDCCDGPDIAPEPNHRVLSKLSSADLVPAMAGDHTVSLVLLRTRRLPRVPSEKPPDDLQALLTVLLI